MNLNLIPSVFRDRLAVCVGVSKAENEADDKAEEIQLNAFEFRNYRAQMDPHQQRLVERVTNQWCAMLVKGKTLKVNDISAKVALNKNMTKLELPQYSGSLYPLYKIRKMEMLKDDVDRLSNEPWGLIITFEGDMEDRQFGFSFEQERHRLHFALTLRLLRTRDPLLDPSQPIEIDLGDDEEAEKKSFAKMADTEHYSTEHSISTVFSVSDLKVYNKLKSTSRHIYLEFFVKYPSQEKFSYAKSPTTQIPPTFLLAEDLGLRRKKEKVNEEQEEEERKKEKEQQQIGERQPLCAMRFEMKNVKLKVPKVPHVIFGRLMAKDEFFPTAIGTFDFEVKKSMLVDHRFYDPKTKRMQQDAEIAKDSAKEPTLLSMKVMSAWKHQSKARGPSVEEEHLHIGTLTLRVWGFIRHRDQILERRAARMEKEKQDRERDEGDDDSEMMEEGGEEEFAEGDEEESVVSEEEIEEEKGSAEGSGSKESSGGS